MQSLDARRVLVVLLVLWAMACRSGPPPDEAANPQATDNPAPTDSLAKPTFADFSKRIDFYMAQRSRAESAVPELKETSDPKKVHDREKALGDAIRTVRADAHQGEIFTEETSTEFRRMIKDDFQKRTPKDQAAVLEEVPVTVPPRINTDYPTAMPLATFPPTLLLNLPTLPDVLEYRFLGPHLILRDIKGNVIVDYIPDVVPRAARVAAARSTEP
jgi:hypothetical protein